MPKRPGEFFAVLLLAIVLSPAVLASSLEEAMRGVEQVRGRRFSSPVAAETISRAGLPDRLRAQLEKTQPYSFEMYSDLLRALYLVREEGNLLPSLLSLLQSQVLAYYDPDTDRFYYVDPLPPGVPESGADVLRDSVVAHELVHALQDQRIDLGKLDRQLVNDWDASLALHAVVEGEATLVMFASLLADAGVSLDDIVANDALVSGAVSAAAMPADDSAPRYFIESLKFPYLAGLRFVVAAYREGGWDAVDELLQNPPRSTREIVDPAEYFARRLPARQFQETTPSSRRFADIRFGQEHWTMLLEVPVRGWLDDTVSVHLDDACRPTVLVRSEWESERAAITFARQYEAFLDKQGAAATVARDGRFVRAAYGFDAGLIVPFLAVADEGKVSR